MAIEPGLPDLQASRNHHTKNNSLAIPARLGTMEGETGVDGNWPSPQITIRADVVGRLDEGQPGFAGGLVDG